MVLRTPEVRRTIPEDKLLSVTEPVSEKVAKAVGVPPDLITKSPVEERLAMRLEAPLSVRVKPYEFDPLRKAIDVLASRVAVSVI